MFSVSCSFLETELSYLKRQHSDTVNQASLWKHSHTIQQESMREIWSHGSKRKPAQDLEPQVRTHSILLILLLIAQASCKQSIPEATIFVPLWCWEWKVWQWNYNDEQVREVVDSHRSHIYVQGWHEIFIFIIYFLWDCNIPSASHCGFNEFTCLKLMLGTSCSS